MMLMPYLVGIVLSLAVAILAKSAGLDRDRAFYPTVVIVVASYGVLFAAISGSAPVLVGEALVMAAFTTVAVWGFQSSPRIVAMALIGHGVFDVFHADMITNPGMPAWWPPFCMAYDVGAGLFMMALSRPRMTGEVRA